MAEDRHHAPTSIPQDQASVRCAVYIRVNIGAVQNAEAIRLQRETAEAFLISREVGGWICVGTYEDIGYSAGKLERPGFECLLADINAGKVDRVIVHTLDRLVRMHEHYVMLMTLLRRRNVKVITVSGEPCVVDGHVRI